MRVNFVACVSNLSKLFKEIIAGKMTLEEYRKTKIISRNVWIKTDIKEDK